MSLSSQEASFFIDLWFSSSKCVQEAKHDTTGNNNIMCAYTDNKLLENYNCGWDQEGEMWK